MFRIRLFSLPSCLVAALVLFASCNDRAAAPAGAQNVTVGAVLPLTGPASHIGEWQKNGIELALERTANATPKPPRFKIVYEDSSGTAKNGLSAFSRILDTRSPTVMLSSLSAVSNAVIAESDRAKVPLVMISVSYPDIAMRSPWAFRNHPGSEDEAQTIAHYLLTQTTIRRVAVFYLKDDFGEGAQKAFRTTFEAAGGRVVFADSYNQDDTDLRSLIAAGKSSDPEGLYVIGYVNSTAALLKQIRELGLRQPLACNMAMGTPVYLEMAGQALEGAYFTVAAFSFEKDKQGTQAAQFAAAYKVKYGQEPSVFAAIAYDTIGMLARACEGREATREVMRQGLIDLKSYDGVMGKLSIDNARNVRFPLEVAVLKNGHLLPAAQPSTQLTR